MRDKPFSHVLPNRQQGITMDRHFPRGLDKPILIVSGAGDTEAARRASIMAAVAHGRRSMLADAVGSDDIVRARNAIHDHHSPLRVDAFMSTVSQTPGVTVADLAALSAAALASAVHLTAEHEREAMRAAVASMVDDMLAQPEAPALAADEMPVAVPAES
jgi:hypothetical protein